MIILSHPLKTCHAEKILNKVLTLQLPDSLPYHYQLINSNARGLRMEELYSIGKLSKIVGLPIGTLRYYDEIGLISPSHVSDDSGYRYYAPHQAADFARVMELKEYGFSLREIKELPSNADTTVLLQKRYAMLIKQQTNLQATMNKLANKIKQQQEVVHMGKRVLLVDDAAFMRMMCRDIFEKNGYEIVGEAETGHVAVSYFNTLSPDLVIMNITMPEMDGIAALRKIRDLNPKANVIMLSAMSQATMVIDALLAGAHSFIAKPFQADMLLDVARASFNGEKAYNRDVLKYMLTHFPDDGGELLSQAQINQLEHTALNATGESEAIEFLATVNEKAPTPRAVFPPSQESENTSILKQLVEGQEKMLLLLEKLVESKAP
jgi:two-component system chemotaxis response regulator CheY